MALNTSKIRNPELKQFFDEKLGYAARLIPLGAPIVATTNRVVTSTNMKNGSYTIANQPDVPRNITVTHSIVATGTDTLGTITITGTDISGAGISEVLTPSAGAAVAGAKAFKTISSVVGAGWTIAGGNDTIVVGVGAKLGLPVKITSASKGLGIVGTALVAGTLVAANDLASNTIDASAGTYDGSKQVFALINE